MVSNTSLLCHLDRFEREGFVSHPEQRSESLASQISRHDDLPELNHAHWLIIAALRAHSRRSGTAALICGHICALNHRDRHCVNDLFSSRREASRVQDCRIPVKARNPTGDGWLLT